MFNFAQLSPMLGRAGLLLQKHSPAILTAAGIAGGVTAGVLASRATLKLKPILDNKDELLAKTQEAREHSPEEYTENHQREDVAKIYITTGLEVAKLYAPSMSLAAVSIICIVGAHGILHRRNVAMAAAYKTLESAFGEYKKRVREQLGDEDEEKLRLNLTEEVAKDEETGEEETLLVANAGCSPYAKFFDELSSQWTKNADYNLAFLHTQQDIFNDLLHSRGHVFLNEVYDALDIPRTKAGQIVGWVSGAKGGDDFIDFGIYDHNNDRKRAFVNGLERSILLDFNVDGPVLDLI